MLQLHFRRGPAVTFCQLGATRDWPPLLISPVQLTRCARMSRSANAETRATGDARDTRLHLIAQLAGPVSVEQQRRRRQASAEFLSLGLVGVCRQQLICLFNFRAEQANKRRVVNSLARLC